MSIGALESSNIFPGSRWPGTGTGLRAHLGEAWRGPKLSPLADLRLGTGRK